MRLVAIPGAYGKLAIIVYHHSGAVWISGEISGSIERLFLNVRNLFGKCEWRRYQNPLMWEARF